VFDGETFGPRSYERLNEILKPERELREFPRPNTLEINRSLKSTIAKAKTLIASYDGNLHGLEYIIARIKNHAASNAISKIAEYGHDEVFYIQIQEGCPCKCSYCAIRLAIKDLKSKPVDDVIEELREGLERGYKKFCLMGDSAAAYGLDIGTNLGNLLGRVREIERNFSLNLTDISPTFLEPCFAEIRALCRDDRIHSLYVPIQSGSPRILRLMKRSCNLDRVKDMLLELKSISRVMIGTSIIVGFPSETSEELKDTIDFCRQVSFDWIYCHSFSARPETEAARLPGQFSAAEVLRRSRLARSALHDKTRITTAEDAKGSRTCQG
jgi:tRNA A37 methylthiotransferase MiaB